MPNAFGFRMIDGVKKIMSSLLSGDLKYELVWILNGPKQFGLQMVWISNGIWNPEAQAFEIRTNGRHFVKNHLKSGQKCPDFEWLIAKARPFKADHLKIWPSKSPDFKGLDFRSPLYLIVQLPVVVLKGLK